MQHTEFKFHPSRFYCVFLSVMLLASGIIILLLPLAIWLRAILLVALLAYGVYLLRWHALLLASSSIIAVRKLEDKRWQVMMRSGELTAALRGDSTITTFVSVLRFDAGDHRRPYSCILFRDSLPAEDYRRLIGIIRMG